MLLTEREVRTRGYCTVEFFFRLFVDRAEPLPRSTNCRFSLPNIYIKYSINGKFYRLKSSFNRHIPQLTEVVKKQKWISMTRN